MEIEQYIYDLNDSGEAIVAYRMSSATGGSVEICNLGASILSWQLPDGRGGLRECGSGSCTRGLRGLEQDNYDGLKFSEMLWESYVETNRVVMSLSYESCGVGVMAQVVFDYDDDNTLEVTYIACGDQESELDFTHLMTFTLDEQQKIAILSSDAVTSNRQLYDVEGSKPSILQEVASVESIESRITIFSSQPAIYCDLSNHRLAPVSHEKITYPAEGRYITKSLYRVALV